MKNHVLTASILCIALYHNGASAEQKNLTTADIIGDSNIMIDAAIGFVDSFAIMGDCQEGQKARKEIETKRDLASGEIQEESKRYEKAKSDYVSKSTTMNDSARDKAEKQLAKMERDIKNLVAEKEEELKTEMQAATEMLAQGLDAGIAQLAKNEHLDVIFDKMTGRAMYVSEKFDFTSKAINVVNEKYEIKLAQNKHAESTLKVAENKTAPAAKAAKIGA
jgi:Skp family chaperone for outer membrane proteins